MTDWPTERDPNKAHLEVVHDKDLGTIAQITHPDGQVFTATDDFGKPDVDYGPVSESEAADPTELTAYLRAEADALAELEGMGVGGKWPVQQVILRAAADEIESLRAQLAAAGVVVPETPKP